MSTLAPTKVIEARNLDMGDVVVLPEGRHTAEFVVIGTQVTFTTRAFGWHKPLRLTDPIEIEIQEDEDY